MNNQKPIKQLLTIWQMLDQCTSEVIQSHNKKEVELNRRNVYQLFETVLFLGRQNIAFWGHDESTSSFNKGNYQNL